MTEKQTTDLRDQWHSEAQNDANFATNTNMIALVRFLARCAAESDFKRHKEDQERQDINDN